MKHNGYKRRGQGWLYSGLVLGLIAVALAAGGCAAPSATPTPSVTPSPRIRVLTATPSPTIAVTRTPRPTRTPAPTATPGPSPTATPSVIASPTPTTESYHLEAEVSDPRPIGGADQFITVRFTHRGQGVAKSWVYVVCHYRTHNVRHPQSGFIETDEDGVADVVFNTVPATPGETVTVDVYVRYGGREFQTQTSFQPR